jgi:hypothetical protein
VPLEDRLVEELTLEELRELTRRQKAEVDAARLRVKKERAESNLHALRALKRFHDVNEDNEVEAIAERSAHKKYRPVAREEVVELSD